MTITYVYLPVVKVRDAEGNLTEKIAFSLEHFDREIDALDYFSGRATMIAEAYQVHGMEVVSMSVRKFVAYGEGSPI